MKKGAVGIAPCLLFVLAGLSSSLGRASENVWSDDAAPVGAVELAGVGDSWNWISSNPAPYSGNLAHQSNLTAGLHEHFFNYATQRLTVGAKDTLFAWVYLDPVNPPSEIMLSWNADNWEHRAYWGTDSIAYGSDHTASRSYVGPLPAAGQWVRLEVPASQVGLAGLTLSGMGFSTYNGRVTYDKAGAETPDAVTTTTTLGSTSTTTSTTTTTAPSTTSTASAPTTTSSGTSSSAGTTTTTTPATGTSTSGTAGSSTGTVWVDDRVPAGATQLNGANESWNWVSANPAAYSGATAHQSINAAGLHEHFFNYATATVTAGATDVIYTYVYLNPANPPSEIMLSWTSDNWEHRAYWGANNISYGSDNTVSRHYMGALPATGQWVRLEVPASVVGLTGMPLSGMGFSTFDGQVTYDKTGVGPTAAAATTTTSTTTTTTTTPTTSTTSTTTSSAPTVTYTDSVWSEDAVPAGAQQLNGSNEGWTWVSSSPAPYAGNLAHQSILAAGLHEHYFNYANPTLPVATGSKLFVYVYLNPNSPPSEIMIAWNADNWEHRAYWGANSISYGGDNTASRHYVGALPAAGQWVRLEVPASAVGLEGLAVQGMDFSTFDGQVTYDHVGIANVASGTTTPVTSTSTGSGSGTTSTTGTTSSTTSTGSGSTSTSGTSTTSTGSGTSTSGGTTSTTSSSSTGTGIVSTSGGTDTSNRTSEGTPNGENVDDTAMQLPAAGNALLHVLAPDLLELKLINAVPSGASAVTSWNLVNSSAQFSAPGAGEFTVTVDGNPVSVSSVGFKRRVLYAPLANYDLRVENSMYLHLSSKVADNQAVIVKNSDGSLWSSSTVFSATVDPLRYSPAIHVNQEGYVPAFAKKAMVGYYLGDGGEMSISAATAFSLVDASSGKSVYTGTLSARAGDSGFNATPAPYQHVMVADFTSFTTPGQYQLQVSGLGASLPFLIDDGIAMAWARTYALGMYEQRSGMATKLPFTRFTHAADHTAPAQIPSPDSDPQFAFTWNCIAGYSSTINTNNPAQVAPTLSNEATSLYPFVNKGSIDTSGGHFDAGDYSKYTENVAQLTHYLIFTVDNMPGVASLDNLGIAESGDGIPDTLQEAKWEADYLLKIQDADGGFYFLVYPKNREYEGNVLPENGDSQVVWPKNTSVSAASTAALAEAASSPAMLKYYPAAAAKYLAAAKLGWQFLTNATTKYGVNGRYQKITFYSDNWTDKDEYAWAAAAMYAATGDTTYQTYLQSANVFPDPTDSSTFRWGWWRMSEGWGNAVRDYAFAARSGRLQASQLNAAYLAKCESVIVAAGDDAVTWSNGSAYGTPFPNETKAVNSAGWYFSLDQASDMAVAYQINPKPAYIDSLVAAMNYEGGTNPVNITYLTGLGMKRQREIVSQYAQNDRRILPPSGIPLGNIQSNFQWISQYGAVLNALSYPSDSATTGQYPFYDRWSDAYNVTTEYIGVNQARSFMATIMLAGLNGATTAKNNWVTPAAVINLPTATVGLNTPTTLTVTVPGQDLTNARVVWEGRDQQPTFGSTFAFSPVNNGDQWVEVEVEWPDGRRAFGAGDFQANSPVQVWIDDGLPAGASPTTGGGDTWNWVSSSPAPHSGSSAVQTSIAAGEHDLTFTGASGTMVVATGDTLYAWIYIDPANVPSEILLAWNDGSSWEHRAYWGANKIGWGNSGTPGLYPVGNVPAAGGWVKISVPASAVNLEGKTVSGMTLALYGGKATWDQIGRAAAGN